MPATNQVGGGAAANGPPPWHRGGYLGATVTLPVPRVSHGSLAHGGTLGVTRPEGSTMSTTGGARADHLVAGPEETWPLEGWAVMDLIEDVLSEVWHRVPADEPYYGSLVALACATGARSTA